MGEKMKTAEEATVEIKKFGDRTIESNDDYETVAKFIDEIILYELNSKQWSWLYNLQEQVNEYEKQIWPSGSTDIGDI